LVSEDRERDRLHYIVIIILCPTVFGLVTKITSKCTLLLVRFYKCKNANAKYDAHAQVYCNFHFFFLFFSTQYLFPFFFFACAIFFTPTHYFYSLSYTLFLQHTTYPSTARTHARTRARAFFLHSLPFLSSPLSLTHTPIHSLTLSFILILFL